MIVVLGVVIEWVGVDLSVNMLLRENECQQYYFGHKDANLNNKLLSSGTVFGVDGPLTMGQKENNPLTIIDFDIFW